MPPPWETDEIPGENAPPDAAAPDAAPDAAPAEAPLPDQDQPPEDPLGEQAEGEEPAEDLSDEVPCIKAAKSMHATWTKLVQEAGDFSMKQLAFVEVVKSRHVKHVLPAVARIHARLRSLGLPLYRLHTDRAREFVSEQMRGWALDRQIISTMTPGSSFKTNGRVEGEMNNVKKNVRTLIGAGACALNHWPMAARHVGERRLRSQLHRLGWPVGRLLRFGCTAFALKKSWQDRYHPWREVREEVTVMGPDMHSSLTNTGYFVQSKTTGRFFYTDDIVIADPAQPAALEDQVLYLPERPDAPAPAPVRRRLRGKQPAVSMRTIEGEKCILAHFGVQFEPLPPLGPYKPPYCEAYSHDDTSSDSWTLSATSDSDYESDPRQEVQGGYSDKDGVPNTWAGGSYPGTSSQALQQETRISALGPIPALRRMHVNLTEYIQDELTRIDGTTADQALWMPTLSEAIQLRVALEDQMMTLAEEAEQLDQNFMVNGSLHPEGADGPPQSEFLVTRTISSREVWDHLSDWEASIRAEHDQLVMQKKAVRQISKAALQQMAEDLNLPIELLPAKMVYTRKAPDGKYRSRAVICGNYAQEDPDVNNYAGGADAVQCRALVRVSATQDWELSGTDIKVAFLHAPKRDAATKITACDIPTVYKRLGLASEDDVWVVEKALYGLPGSPRDWSVHRDEEIPKMRWNRTVEGLERCGRFVASGDDHLWRMIETEAQTGKDHWVNLMAVYVDDILIGAEPGARDGAMKALESKWNISAVETASATNPLRFCGVEITKNVDGDGFHIDQYMYEKETLSKWAVTEKTAFPIFKVSEEDELEKAFDPTTLREAQALTGALLWLSTRSRPDLAYGLSAMSRLVARNPEKTLEIGRALLAYIHGNPGGLHYPRNAPHGAWGARQQLKVARHAKLLEVFSDIAYGAGSKFRSIQGICIFFGGVPIAWQCSQQPFVTHSTAEAELVSYCEGLLAGRATEALLCSMFGEALQSNTLERVLYGDNTTATGLAEGSTSSSWRARHLRIRASVLREAMDDESQVPGGPWRLSHLSGKELVADGCTKPLNGQAFFRFFEDLNMKSRGSVPKTARTSEVEVHGDETMELALKTMIAGSLLVSGAAASSTDDSGDDGFSSFLTVGAILAAVGAVYVGQLAHSATRCCLRRLKTVAVGAEGQEKSSEEPALESPAEAARPVTVRRRATGKGGTVPSTSSMSSLRPSGLSIGDAAGSGCSISMTPSRQSGSSIAAEVNAGSVALSLSLASADAAGSEDAAGARASTSLPPSGSADVAAARSLTPLPQSGSSAERPAPRNAAHLPEAERRPGVEIVEGGIAFNNPWNLFQHLNRKKGWSQKKMSEMYKIWKTGRN